MTFYLQGLTKRARDAYMPGYTGQAVTGLAGSARGARVARGAGVAAAGAQMLGASQEALVSAAREQEALAQQRSEVQALADRVRGYGGLDPVRRQNLADALTAASRVGGEAGKYIVQQALKIDPLLEETAAREDLVRRIQSAAKGGTFGMMDDPESPEMLELQDMLQQAEGGDREEAEARLEDRLRTKAARAGRLRTHRYLVESLRAHSAGLAEAGDSVRYEAAAAAIEYLELVGPDVMDPDEAREFYEDQVDGARRARKEALEERGYNASDAQLMQIAQGYAWKRPTPTPGQTYTEPERPPGARQNGEPYTTGDPRQGDLRGLQGGSGAPVAPGATPAAQPADLQKMLSEIILEHAGDPAGAKAAYERLTGQSWADIPAAVKRAAIEAAKRGQ